MVWEEVRSSPILDDSGAVKHVVEVWRDISMRRQAEAKMAEAHRLASLGMLASGFSHELNTPLATVLTCVESILRMAEAAVDGGSDGSKPIERSAGIAREQLLRCRTTTQHLLRLASDHEVRSEVVDVDAAVDQAVRLATPTADAVGVSIRIERFAGGGAPGLGSFWRSTLHDAGEPTSSSTARPAPVRRSMSFGLRSRGSRHDPHVVDARRRR